MKCQNHLLYRVSCTAFSVSIWLLFGVSLWRMDFSLADVVRFGQTLADSATLSGAEEAMQSGFLR